MAINKDTIISDIELRLTKGKPSDDIAIYRNQISHWIDITRDGIVTSLITSLVMNGEEIDPFYIDSDLCLSPVAVDDDCIDCPNKLRFYIETTRDILSLPGERGIIRITDNNGKDVSVFSENEINFLRNMPFSKPTKGRQSAYREGSRRIFIEKLDELSLEYFEYDVFYIPKMVGSNIDESENYPIAEEDLSELIESVVEIGLRQINLGIADIENDGTDPSHYAGD